jgi:hypothetical protein
MGPGRRPGPLSKKDGRRTPGMSFLRHRGNLSIRAESAGRERVASLPTACSCGRVSRSAIPWQVALQQSLPLLRRPGSVWTNPPGLSR